MRALGFLQRPVRALHVSRHTAKRSCHPALLVCHASISTQGDSPFLCGVAMSVYQNSGGPNTNWSRFEDYIKPDGTPGVKNGARCGVACNFWDNYAHDIALAASLGSNVFRFSMEWSRIVPEKGIIDQQAVDRYHEIIDCIKSNDMEPFITLHHFVEPDWFVDIGGFEDEENVSWFTEYAAFAAREYGTKATYFATFNEANVVANCGWIFADFPPAKVNEQRLAGVVLGNMYKAHAAALQAMKAQPGCGHLRIGLVDSYMRWSALPDSGEHAHNVAAVNDHTWANNITREFLVQGTFDWNPSTEDKRVSWALESSITQRPLCDWVGINYYSRMVLGADLQGACYPGETLTTMGYALYAPGLLEGMQHYSAVGVPLYITETGCPDPTDTVRPIMIATYMPQVVQAMEDPSIDLRGVMHWSLMDNWEWARGWTEHFGLFAWSPGSDARVPRETSVELWKKWCAYFIAKGAGQQVSPP